MYQAWGYDAWAAHAHTPASHHSWLAPDGQHWSDYSAGQNLLLPTLIQALLLFKFLFLN